MTNNTPTRKIINVALIVIVALLLVLNLQFVRLHFLLFSINLPLVFIMVGMFLAWWYVSKAFGGQFSKAQLEQKLSSVEKSVGTSVEKATESIKDAVEDIKDQIDEAKKTTATKKVATPTRKTPAKKPAATKKPSTRTVTKK